MPFTNSLDHESPSTKKKAARQQKAAAVQQQIRTLEADRRIRQQKLQDKFLTRALPETLNVQRPIPESPPTATFDGPFGDVRPKPKKARVSEQLPERKPPKIKNTQSEDINGLQVVRSKSKQRQDLADDLDPDETQFDAIGDTEIFDDFAADISSPLLSSDARARMEIEEIKRDFARRKQRLSQKNPYRSKQPAIVGEIISALSGFADAKDAYNAFEEGFNALDEGEKVEAVKKFGEGGIAALVVIPAFKLGKLGKLFEKASRRASTSINGKVRQLSPVFFRKHVNSLLSKKKDPQLISTRLATMNTTVQSFVKRQGFDVGDGGLDIMDRKLLRMVRPKKPPKQRLPEEMIMHMPELFKNPKAVLWDKNEKALLYVVDIPNDKRKGKFVVRVEFKQDINRGDKKVVKTSGFVQSGGRVPVQNLLNQKNLEIVDGEL